MNSLILHYVSGEAFFSGLLLLIIAVILSLFKPKFVRYYLAGIVCAVGAVNIVASSTPLPIWIYILLGISAAALLISIESDEIKNKYKLIIKTAVCLVTFLAVGMELPFWLEPKPVRLKSKTIFVIGDSMSAGTGFKGERTWPEIIAENYDLNVINKSVGGGTAKSSIESLKKIKNINKDDLVIIEIGGNDMLKHTSASDFRKNLSKLITNIKTHTQNIIMLELPLLPFYNGFGKAQRELASEFDIVLIPKKYFSWAFKGKNSTIDGLHFSNFGHEKMAEVIMEYIVNK